MKTTSLLNRLQEARRLATEAKITLRHAKNVRSDHHVYLLGGLEGGYDGLGKNADARKLALAGLLAKDEHARKYEDAVQDAENTFDYADTELACVLDEKHIANDQTWAILADWVRDRTGHQMSGRDRAGREMLEEQVEKQVEKTLADELEEYQRYDDVDLETEAEEDYDLPPELDDYKAPF